MYDIHSHILPAFDDGAADLETALEMARIACADGVTHMVCTPHIYPALYDYDTRSIQQAIDSFAHDLKQADISLELAAGADIQMVPEMLARLNDKTMPTINGSNYLLFEPPHHVAPFNFEAAVMDVCSAGYIPIITHPERLSWIENYYQQFVNVAAGGAWLQITAGSLTGNFGKHARYWAERLLDEGIVHVIASDTHNISSRSPILSEGVAIASKWIGEAEARATVYDRPKAVWDNIPAANVRMPPGYDINGVFMPKKKPGFLRKLFGTRH